PHPSLSFAGSAVASWPGKKCAPIFARSPPSSTPPWPVSPRLNSAPPVTYRCRLALRSLPSLEKMDESTPHLSIVVPLYNAAGTLPALHQEISALEVPGGHELILVNDGSRDETEAVALKLTRESQLPMRFLSLSRNFGEHNAVLAGLRAVSGRYVVTMDDDLQNPPSEALKLLAAAESQKCDVVYGIYERKEHAWWRNAGSWLTNRIADFVVDKPR